jgi:ABC-type uncharacterized transport system auxiliary subunit
LNTSNNPTQKKQSPIQTKSTEHTHAFGPSNKKNSKTTHTHKKQKTSKTSTQARKTSQVLKPEPKVHKIIPVDETVIKLNGENVWS